jgi:hypothetical protein
MRDDGKLDRVWKLSRGVPANGTSLVRFNHEEKSSMRSRKVVVQFRTTYYVNTRSHRFGTMRSAPTEVKQELFKCNAMWYRGNEKKRTC